MPSSIAPHLLRTAVALTIALAACPALAQRAAPATPKPDPQKIDPKAPAAAPEPVPPPEELPPPYEKEMLRLSEIMGSLAYLRTLCDAPDRGEWRAKMAALLDVEATTPTRRERLAGAYNKGFRGYAVTYRSCTPSATLTIERYLAEGQKLARAISGRFGG